MPSMKNKAAPPFMMNLSDLSPSGGIGTIAQQVYASGYLRQIGATNYLMIWNIAPNGGGVIWLNYNGVAQVDTPGPFALYPGESQIFSEGLVPTNGLSAVATVAGTPLTVKVA